MICFLVSAPVAFGVTFIIGGNLYPDKLLVTLRAIAMLVSVVSAFSFLVLLSRLRQSRLLAVVTFIAIVAFVWFLAQVSTEVLS